MKLIDYHSGSAIPIELWYNDNFLSSATGFFYRRNDTLYLISNWHVFSGRNANDGQPLNAKSGAIPNRIGLILHANPLGFATCPIYQNLTQEPAASWIQHSKGQEVDIGGIAIKSLPAEALVHSVQDRNYAEKLYKGVGSECFVVGYPIKATLGNHLPIWKRATVASESALPYRGHDRFLIDATTSEGMSGSPVFFRQIGIILTEERENWFEPGTIATEFAGIYSGRVHSGKDGTLDLGYVWSYKLIDEMIDGQVLGAYEIKKS